MTNFSDTDLKQITEHGLTLDAIQQQLQYFQSGFPYSDIVEPATIGNGILPSPSDSVAQHWRNERNKYSVVKFVPASGAATRMFRDLYEFLDSGTMNKTTRTVLDNLEKFAFYDDLLATLPQNPDEKTIISHIVSIPGINYGKLPKALLKFHKYSTGGRTALAEHMIEGAQYAATNGMVNIHFTISPEHRHAFDAEIAKLVPEYGQKFGIKYNIETSVQMSRTDTIAVTPDNELFRTDDGKLLFRPAGHGALIENLNKIDADIIFIKNIDNICPDRLRDITTINKEKLAGVAIQIQTQIFQYIRDLDNNIANPTEIAEFITNYLGVRGISKHTPLSEIRKILNRPLRVCGMIKNTGEPGGGPFWTRGTNGRISLQIAEPGQISAKDKHILTNGEFFSPTDLVCAPRDAYGKKFNLTEYVDPTAGFISDKSANGRPLRAMERPGLWNGAMADWNTTFVATPLETFTPVKVVTDLISANHTA